MEKNTNCILYFAYIMLSLIIASILAFIFIGPLLLCISLGAPQWAQTLSIAWLLSLILVLIVTSIIKKKQLN